MWPRLRETFDANSIRGTVHDTAVWQGYVYLYFKKSSPRDGIAIPIAEFYQDLLLPAASNNSGVLVGAMLNLGSKYKGDTVVAKGLSAKQSDGSRIVFVQHLSDVRFIE